MTSPLARSSRPIRRTGRFCSRTAAVRSPGATATHDHAVVFTYFCVVGFSSQ
ncbi:hypothetical protein ACFU6S_30155 [Streptomyces sp. NPDC057456]|uniref:hypothetical protein n=1 Tax=Streptomyces sp. NPDC057456 TaxID=3346139 RepID=UPI003696D05C